MNTGAPNTTKSVVNGQPQGSCPYKTIIIAGCGTSAQIIDNPQIYEWGETPSMARLWQRNYYEHVIRDDNDYESIADYILTNPFNWEKDDENITPSRS